jgi:hypothetical protein
LRSNDSSDACAGVSDPPAAMILRPIN